MTEELRPKRRGKQTPEELERTIVEAKASPDYVSPLREAHDYPPLGSEEEIAMLPSTTEIDLVAEVTKIIEEDALLDTPRGRVYRGLHAKLAEMLGEIGHVQKTGQAPSGMGGFKFTEASHLAEIIREALASKMISMLPERQEVAQSTEFKSASNKTQFLVTVLTTWRLTDAETGESVTFQSFGSGQDNSDKAFPKAMTNSMKYAHLMAWLVPQSDDPERFENELKGDSDIRIEGSNVEGLVFGGRSKNATDPQIDAIRRRARELNLDPGQLATVIESVTGEPIDLGPVGGNDKVGFILDILRKLSFDDAATVVRYLMDALSPDDQAELAMGPEDVGAK